MLISEREILEILLKHITICKDRMCLRSPNTARIQLSIYNKSDYSDFKKLMEIQADMENTQINIDKYAEEWLIISENLEKVESILAKDTDNENTDSSN